MDSIPVFVTISVVDSDLFLYEVDSDLFLYEADPICFL